MKFSQILELSLYSSHNSRVTRTLAEFLCFTFLLYWREFLWVSVSLPPTVSRTTSGTQISHSLHEALQIHKKRLCLQLAQYSYFLLLPWSHIIISHLHNTFWDQLLLWKLLLWTLEVVMICFPDRPLAAQLLQTLLLFSVSTPAQLFVA